MLAVVRAYWMNGPYKDGIPFTSSSSAGNAFLYDVFKARCIPNDQLGYIHPHHLGSLDAVRHGMERAGCPRASHQAAPELKKTVATASKTVVPPRHSIQAPTTTRALSSSSSATRTDDFDNIIASLKANPQALR